MGDVVIQANRPEAILQPSECERSVFSRQGKVLRCLCVGECQDRSEAGTEAFLPAYETIEIVGRDPVLPVPSASSVPGSLPFDLDDEVTGKPGIEQEVRVLHPFLAEERAPRLINGDAGNPKRPNVVLEGGLVVVPSYGHG
jgi:hypothetical protein